MNRNAITKNEAKLDTWVAEAMRERARIGIKAVPTSQECRDAYAMGESPATWAAYVAGQDAA